MSTKKVGIVQTGLTRIEQRLAKVQRQVQTQGAVDQANRDELGIIRNELRQLLDVHLKRGLLPKIGPPKSDMIPKLEEAVEQIEYSLESGSDAVAHLEEGILRVRIANDIMKSM